MPCSCPSYCCSVLLRPWIVAALCDLMAYAWFKPLFIEYLCLNLCCCKMTRMFSVMCDNGEVITVSSLCSCCGPCMVLEWG